MCHLISRIIGTCYVLLYWYRTCCLYFLHNPDMEVFRHTVLTETWRRSKIALRQEMINDFPYQSLNPTISVQTVCIKTVLNTYTPYEPRQANLCLRAFRHDKFQPRMPSHSEGPRIWLSVWRFLLIHCLYERAAKVLARLRGCAGSPEPSLLA